MAPEGDAADQGGRLGQARQRLDDLLQLVGCDDFSLRHAGQFFQHLGPGRFAGAFGRIALDEERRVEAGPRLLAGQLDLVLAGLLSACSGR